VKRRLSNKKGRMGRAIKKDQVLGEREKKTRSQGKDSIRIQNCRMGERGTTKRKKACSRAKSKIKSQEHWKKGDGTTARARSTEGRGKKRPSKRTDQGRENATVQEKSMVKIAGEEGKGGGEGSLFWLRRKLKKKPKPADKLSDARLIKKNLHIMISQPKMLEKNQKRGSGSTPLAINRSPPDG